MEIATFVFLYLAGGFLMGIILKLLRVDLETWAGHIAGFLVVVFWPLTALGILVYGLGKETYMIYVVWHVRREQRRLGHKVTFTRNTIDNSRRWFG